ncbi:MAG: DNA polymerase III subunit gamma/tau [Alkalispirochaeta sp.]
MSYEVTATRRRPRTFDEMIGQDFVVATLKSSLASGRIAHAYLFSGPRGVGKTSAARILAKALNCPDGPNPDGCEDWAGSEEIARGTALDVIEIDGASNTSVNDVREIKDEVLFAPNDARYKIYIIDEVHMLSNSAFNALLKTIEEPPPYIVFIFATTEIHKVPPTIRSRCQQFNFRLIPMDEIKPMLAQAAEDMGLQADDDALAWVAKEATGSLRDAYTLFDQVAAFSDGHLQLEVIHEKLGLLGLERLNALMTAIMNEEPAEALEIVDQAVQSGVAVERFAMDLADYLRTLLLISAGIDREAILGMRPERIPEEVRGGWDRGRIEFANELVLQLYRDLRYSVNQRFDLELAISRLASLTSIRTPQALVKEIKALQEELIHEGAYRRRHGGAETGGDSGDGRSSDGVGPHADGTVVAPGTDGSAGVIAGRAGDGAAVSEGVPDADIDPNEPPEVDGISLEQVQAIVARFRAQRISVAALLSRARLWRLREEELLIAFADEFGANALSSDRDAVQAAAAAELGRERTVVRIQTLSSATDGGEEEGSGTDPRVDMVRRVFRGEIVEDHS